ncbi:MAG TPA: hypothetical protein VKV77_08010 [Methylovirgula sp.]|nr:hypothetical protein [Methylovirgula sp.]
MGEFTDDLSDRSRAAEYEETARTCLSAAVEASDAAARATLLNVALHWAKLAELAAKNLDLSSAVKRALHSDQEK